MGYGEGTECIDTIPKTLIEKYKQYLMEQRRKQLIGNSKLDAYIKCVMTEKRHYDDMITIFDKRLNTVE